MVGSEVPNLLEADAASTLVVSQDVDLGVPVCAHGTVKDRALRLSDFRQHEEEPSVLVPTAPELIEVNLIGIDSDSEIGEAYVLDDPELPLMVFGALRLLREGGSAIVDDLEIPLPRPAGLVLEKLLTDRSGVKGERDLLVALAVLMVSGESDLDEVVAEYVELPADLRHAVKSNLTVLSLMEAHALMPDPVSERERVAQVLERLEEGD